MSNSDMPHSARPSGRRLERRFSLPAAISSKIERELAALDFPVSHPGKIAQAVLRLSDHYNINPLASTPWDEVWAQAAQLAYYFPLNFARNSAVAAEAKRLGFLDHVTSLTDFGSGAGSALYAFGEHLIDPVHLVASDVSDFALSLGARLKPETWPENRPVPERHVGSLRMSPEIRAGLRPEASNLLVASFVRTELRQLPDDWLDFSALAIVEPSTAEDSRRLMQERQILVEKGYRIWAPCTHEGACPLLTHSERDWCHDRIHWDAPAWFLAVEKLLPMKNRTLTFSYLLAKKETAAPSRLKEFARLTGDMLVEKGKTRQSLCRSPEREFLSWFPQRMPKPTKEIPELDLQRGYLVRLSPDLEKKSQEVRLKSASQLEQLPADQRLDRS